MTKVTYQPTDGSEFTEVFGQFVEAGQSVDVTDERQLEKLKGHPEFKVAGQKPEAEDKARAQSDERLAKAVDGRSKEAREARAKANELAADAAAKERAAAQAQALADARAEADANR